jgi:large subunit ribosomal protein L5
MEDFSLSNPMQLPRLNKIVINAGIGKLYKDNKDNADSFFHEIYSLAGQKPVYRKSRISEAGFSVRKNDIIGITTTLRGDRMWNFLEKLIRVSLPRVRDFRGVSKSSFDGSGNYSVGIREHVIFPEVDANKTKGIRPLQVTLVFSNSNPERSKKLLSHLGMPFSK